MGTGGMFGNELFFFISGYGLSLSLGRQRVGFGAWILKRFKRVYEPLALATTLLLLIGFYQVRSVSGLITLYSGFRTYWFLPIIVIFYCPLYFVIVSARERLAFALSASAALIVYVAAYLTVVDQTRFDVESHVLSKAPFYFLVMLLGVYAARRWGDVRTRWPDLALLVFATAAYLADQFAMRAYGGFELQFAIHLIGMVWIVAVYRCVGYPGLSRLETGVPSKVIAFLSSIALQIYLLQELFIQSSSIKALTFPASVLVFWLLVLPSAWLFKKASFGDAGKFFSRRESGSAT
jgi:peptidoglycan/LPS O-acetylase OafA/YrhL